MAVTNTIKIQQIDNSGLFSFIQSGLGVQVTGNSTVRTYNEIFSGQTNFNGAVLTTGSFTTSGQTTFVSGFTSNTGINVKGTISGQKLVIDSFSLPTGTLGTAQFGSMTLTGIPIYDSGQASVAVTLPSGTVFGLRQYVNAPQLVSNVSGNLTPFTGAGTTVVMLCMSVGS